MPIGSALLLLVCAIPLVIVWLNAISQRREVKRKTDTLRAKLSLANYGFATAGVDPLNPEVLDMPVHLSVSFKSSDVLTQIRRAVGDEKQTPVTPESVQALAWILANERQYGLQLAAAFYRSASKFLANLDRKAPPAWLIRQVLEDLEGVHKQADKAISELQRMGFLPKPDQS